MYSTSIMQAHRLVLPLVRIGYWFACIVALLSSPALAQTDDLKLPLHLPVSGEQSDALVTTLQQLADAADLSNLKVVSADRWLDYQQGIRSGRRGLYLAAPHFAAWAIHNHNFSPLIRLPGSLSYVVAAARNDASIFEMNDLANQAVCSRQPLNLDYLMINRAFDNPLLSARIQIVPSVRAEMRRASSRCRGFSLTDREFELIAAIFHERYIRLQQSIKYSNLVLIADPSSSKVQTDLVEAVADLLSSKAAREALSPWLREWSGQPVWIKAQRGDYPRSYMQVLESFWRRSVPTSE